MKITVLTENAASGKFQAEHGLSYLIDIDGEKILWDTGHSDLFLKNAEKLGINIHENVNKVVLSHGHWDHGDGLKFINNKTLIAHPSAFIKRYRKSDQSPVGLTLSKDEIQKKFNLIETTTPYKITKNLWFLGEIPRVNNFESKASAFKKDDGADDFVPDDSALAAIVKNQLVIITGCSHSGICNIAEYAKKVCKISKIKMILGGFHLKYNGRQTQNTIGYLKKSDVENVSPSHCTGLSALSAFHQEFKSQQVKSGMIFEF